jgi:hypothetical protein
MSDSHWRLLWYFITFLLLKNPGNWMSISSTFYVCIFLLISFRKKVSQLNILALYFLATKFRKKCYKLCLILIDIISLKLESRSLKIFYVFFVKNYRSFYNQLWFEKKCFTTREIRRCLDTFYWIKNFFKTCNETLHIIKLSNNIFSFKDIKFANRQKGWSWSSCSKQRIIHFWGKYWCWTNSIRPTAFNQWSLVIFKLRGSQRSKFNAWCCIF